MAEMEFPFATKNDIIEVDDLAYEDVPVKEWKRMVRLITLTGTQRDDFEAKSYVHRKGNREMNLINFRARLLSLCLVGQDNKRLFPDVDVPLLGQKSASVLEPLFDKARAMNGMTDQDIEELTEGFDGDPSEDSTSD